MRWLRIEFWWALHNLVAHPVSQVAWWMSLCGWIRPISKFGDWLHDATIPEHQPHEGRG